jgi:hypothetical protein
MASGAYFNLRGWSAFAWAQLANGASVDDTQRLIADHAAATDPATTPDASAVGLFADELVDHGLLVPGDPTHEHTDVPVPTTSWTGLTVEAFTDMADLILLDPVHDVDANKGWPQPPTS